MEIECLTPEFPQGARVYSSDGIAPTLLNSASAMRSQSILSTVRDKPLPALLICAGDTSGFAKLIDPPFSNAPSGSCFFDRHIGTPPLQFVKNIITTIPNKINCIIPNDNGIIWNSFVLRIFCSF